MEEAIRDLLNALEAAEVAGAPLNDSVIRDSLHEVIRRGFELQEPGYRVPGDLLLNYTAPAEQQNGAVVAALQRFLVQARGDAATAGLNTTDLRLAAFLHSEVLSSSGEVSVGSYFD